MSASSDNTPAPLANTTKNNVQEETSKDANKDTDKVVEVTADDTDASTQNGDTTASNVDDKAATEKTDENTNSDDSDDIDSTDNVPCDPEGDGQECAQPPEPKVTITSPSPDVVIATLEEPEVPSAEDEASEADGTREDTKPADTATKAADETATPTADDTAKMTAEDTAMTQTTAHHDSADTDTPAVEAQTPALERTDNSNESDSVNDVESDTDSDAAPTATNKTDTPAIERTPTEAALKEDAPNEEGLSEEEVIKEEKEAKLESYKQFVAEQFSDKKIDYPEVRVSIEANALPSKMYFVMNTLSAIIASYGLVTNSAAVVIGAMLVAMMLGPITGAALAVIDYRMPLLRKSLLTVLAGISLVIVVGFVVGLLHQGQPLTNEILSRTQPTSMDLMIALAGGTAGAYAMVSPHLSVAVVGVAVATALVPPLAASGILFANGEMQLGAGALLLAITNIIAIQFTNAMVLWFLGFRRLVEDDYKSGTYLTFLRRNAVTLLLLVGLGVYLTLNLKSNANQQAFENQVKDAINQHFDNQGNVLTNTQFDKVGGHQVIRAVIRGETIPSATDVREIEQVIMKNMNEKFPGYLPVKLQLRYLPVQVIESDPRGDDKLDETDAAILSNTN
ncbi:DUF389 domain-containing protein [Psychrobacter aestuarii]|uniref:DUF389 domain-containing protein n=1 Tax=Psychrobacter aestuarii TaxID=556327 RepID=A0ABP3FMV0_9GAMM|nr:DUF389 domain-containing protein [Psychrobacter aestuarii]